MAKKSQAKPKSKVYSYIRFSTPEQAMGDSERRQLELAKEFAARKKLQLDESLRDEGLSGYHGTHRKKGVLGKFLKRIEDGKIPRGSILVVENIDRLGREDVMTALSTIQTIIEHDITIVTLSPYEQEYTRISINEGLIYQLIGEIKRANGESKMKSKRLRAVREQARKAARETGRLMTSKVPHWITVNGDGKLEPISEAVKCVQRIFELKRQGVGMQTIAKKLNEDNGWSPPPTKKADIEAGKPGNGWRSSYVKKITTNRAVIGEYQPHVKVEGKRVPEGEPIAGYYPRVIDDDLFFAVQTLTQGNRGGGGRKDKCTNLFQRIVKCAYCGGTMQFVDKGKPPKGQKYLRCENGYRSHDCQRYTIRYDECETLILDNCQRLKPDQILPNPGEQAERCQALRLQLDGKEAELGDLAKQITNLVEQIGATASETMRGRYETRAIVLEGKQQEVKTALGQLKHDLVDAEKAASDVRQWTRSLNELREAIAQDGAAELRMRLRLHLQEFITKIEIFANGYQNESDPEADIKGARSIVENGHLKYIPAPMPNEDDFYEVTAELVSEHDPELWGDKIFRSFVQQVAEQRLTKKGRFVRVHFKTKSAVVDLVPEGSLASGMEMVEDRRRRVGWRFVRPQLDRMWRDYKTEYRSKNGKKRT